VILYSAFADDILTVPAAIAGGRWVARQGRADLRSPRRFAAWHRATRRCRPVPGLLEAAAARLDPEDLPILSMRLDRTSPDEIADIIGSTVCGAFLPTTFCMASGR
jgi:hypothetical protein